MEISDITQLEPSKIQHHNSSTDSQQSEPESPSLEMTVVLNLNETNPYWADAPLRCASNSEMSPGGKARRDFKFQVIHVNSGPRWFVWPSNKPEEVTELAQPPTLNNGSSDQENQNVRRSMRYMSRRKISNEFNKTALPTTQNDFFEENLCKATATNQIPDTPMSEPTTRRINSKPICRSDSPIDSRFKVTKASLSVSPPSTSSDCSTFSNQSTLSSITSSQSDTFQILSVQNNTGPEEYEDEQMDQNESKILKNQV